MDTLICILIIFGVTAAVIGFIYGIVCIISLIDDWKNFSSGKEYIPSETVVHSCGKIKPEDFFNWIKYNPSSWVYGITSCYKSVVEPETETRRILGRPGPRIVRYYAKFSLVDYIKYLIWLKKSRASLEQKLTNNNSLKLLEAIKIDIEKSIESESRKISKEDQNGRIEKVSGDIRRNI